MKQKIFDWGPLNSRSYSSKMVNIYISRDDSTSVKKKEGGLILMGGIELSGSDMSSLEDWTLNVTYNTVNRVLRNL